LRSRAASNLALVADDATAARPRRNGRAAPAMRYRLDDQVGFMLRRVSQRHVAIFARHMEKDITPTRWATLAKLYEEGPTTQNRLGRLTAMDAATIKGVVDRLIKRHLIETRADPDDGRRRVVALTEAGRTLVERSLGHAAAISRKTLEPLSAREQASLLELLRKLA
jgi:MarR family transcriptional regulator, lower aerobic nicotinate degradation pathway regulator